MRPCGCNHGGDNEHNGDVHHFELLGYYLRILKMDMVDGPREISDLGSNSNGVAGLSSGSGFSSQVYRETQLNMHVKCVYVCIIVYLYVHNIHTATVVAHTHLKSSERLTKYQSRARKLICIEAVPFL